MLRVILDYPGDNYSARRRVFANPARVLVASRLDDLHGVLDEVDRAARDGFHAVGFISYEAAPAFDRAMRVHSAAPYPLACFGLFDGYSEELPIPSTTVEASWTLDVERSAYLELADRIRDAIAAGNVYQVNLTVRQCAQMTGCPLVWYEKQRRAQGPGYHAFLELEDFAIASLSPELFFTRRDDVIVTRPMKGTRPRGRWSKEDEELRAELYSSTKDRAELLMIVDLLRNDVGRIARPGGVRVLRNYHVERYRTVWQMTATIEGDVAHTVPLPDVFRALFPCGSVTGAPKIAAMKMIADMETSPRGVYCGAIGVVEPGGDCTFSVPIRTAVIDKNGSAIYGVGSGITWDSNGHAELEELIAKSAVLSEAWPEFELIETMRLQDGVVRRLDLHMDRLTDSARYFDMPIDRAQVKADIERVANAHSHGAWRLRLLLGRGPLRIDAYPLEEAPHDPALVRLARVHVSSRDRFLFHKTTNRAMYVRAQLPGAFDTLLHNERAEVTEFTRGNVVIEMGGRRVTPPLESGLLPGVFRQQLLNEGEIEERVITIEDVKTCTRIWLINSVREWVPVQCACA